MRTWSDAETALRHSDAKTAVWVVALDATKKLQRIGSGCDCESGAQLVWEQQRHHGSVNDPGGLGTLGT
jgi:hypothetical protein